METLKTSVPTVRKTSEIEVDFRSARARARDLLSRGAHVGLRQLSCCIDWLACRSPVSSPLKRAELRNKEGSYNNLGYYNLSSSKRDGYAVIFLWETKSYLHYAIKLFARSPDIS